MGNLSDISTILLSALMGLLGGLMTIPISAIAFRMLKNREDENQRKLDMVAKKQELLRHRLEFQRHSQTSRRIRAIIAEIKAGQKKQAEDINGISAANDENIAAIRKSLTELDHNTISLLNRLPEFDERLFHIEESKTDDTIRQVFMIQTETRLSVLEEMHDGLKRDS